MKSNRSPARLSEYLVLACILMHGLFFRVRRLGDDPFFQDQAATSMGALQVVEGSWPLVGPMSFSFSTTLRDPPLPSYLYAMPFAVSGDPRIARIFTALWNLFSISLAYKICRLYFGRNAGLFASALYAVHPTAVLASRFIWNPNLAAPFVMLFLYTGLQGYYQSRWFARVMHLPALALAVLCHPSLTLLAPVSLLFWLWAWWNQANERRALLVQGGASAAIAMLLLVPWLAGNLQLAAAAQPAADLSTFGNWVRLQSPDLNVLKTVLAGEGCWRNNCPMLLGERPPVFMTHFLPNITLLATAWTLLLGALRRRVFPALVIAAAFFLPPAIASATGRVFDHYVWPLTGNAVIIQAAVLSAERDSRSTQGHQFIKSLMPKSTRRLIQFSYALVMALILFGQARFNFLYNPQESLPSLNQNLATVRYALKTALDAGAELILQDYQPPDELRCIGCRGWETLPALLGHDLRVLPQDSGVPAPSTGAYLLRSTSWPHEDGHLLEKETVNTWFQLSRIPTASETQLDITTAEPYRFANGALVLGLATASPAALSRASEDWRPSLVWRAGDATTTDYKLFAHFLDFDGRKYAQADPLALPGRYWRAGETVVSELDFKIAEDLPEDGSLFIRFGMYDQHGNVPVLDRAGAPLVDHATIQIRGGGKPAWVFTESLVLDEIDMASEQQQGPPLVVTATWHAREGGLQKTQLRWRIVTRAGKTAFETLTDIAPHAGVGVLLAPAFVAAEYGLRIPTDIRPGTYRLELQPIAQAGHALGNPFSAAIQLTSRNRNFDLPPMQSTLGATFADQIRLAGYDLEHSNGTLTLVLHWQALGQIAADYKYFVHAWSEIEVVAQADAMPDSYRYPTSWWAPHEVFSDTVTVNLDASAPAEITLKVGLYLPDGDRIPITDRDGNTVPFTTLELGQVHLSR
ncbi:MAG TPA: glycosyltransferase family 39 protein [Anaerolineales bacterium]|nr:glycosyltransferase family 39 protein [Anaerolineales bacterium]